METSWIHRHQWLWLPQIRSLKQSIFYQQIILVPTLEDISKEKFGSMVRNRSSLRFLLSLLFVKLGTTPPHPPKKSLSKNRRLKHGTRNSNVILGVFAMVAFAKMKFSLLLERAEVFGGCTDLSLGLYFCHSLAIWPLVRWMTSIICKLRIIILYLSLMLWRLNKVTNTNSWSRVHTTSKLAAIVFSAKALWESDALVTWNGKEPRYPKYLFDGQQSYYLCYPHSENEGNSGSMLLMIQILFFPVTPI